MYLYHVKNGNKYPPREIYQCAAPPFSAGGGGGGVLEDSGVFGKWVDTPMHTMYTLTTNNDNSRDAFRTNSNI